MHIFSKNFEEIFYTPLWFLVFLFLLFFLCTSVKIHFFKTFILPYFDYCLSLIIYFPPSAYQSLNNCFNLCLYKLFKFKPEATPEDEDENEEKIMSDLIDKLILMIYLRFSQEFIINFFFLLTVSNLIKNHLLSPKLL